MAGAAAGCFRRAGRPVLRATNLFERALLAPPGALPLGPSAHQESGGVKPPGNGVQGTAGKMTKDFDCERRITMML